MLIDCLASFKAGDAVHNSGCSEVTAAGGEVGLSDTYLPSIMRFPKTNKVFGYLI
jgi:hypothetical protein